MSAKDFTRNFLITAMASAVVVGFAVTLLVQATAATFAEGTDRCATKGSGSAACPEGHGTSVVLSTFALMVFVPVVVIGFRRMGRLERLPMLFGRLSVSVLAVVGIYPGTVVFDALHGSTVKATWSAPSDKVADASTAGVWTVGDAVVRAWSDGLTAFDAGSGAQRWTLPLQKGATLCGMSHSAVGGVGLLATWVSSTWCAKVSAVDAATGRTLWTRSFPRNAEMRTAGGTGSVAIAAKTAVVRLPRRLQALDMRDGAPRWKRTVSGAGCRFAWVAGAPARILAAETCSQGETTTVSVRSLDPATGRDQWTARVPSTGKAEVVPVAADPLVLHVRERDKGRKESLMALDAEGRITATIPAEASAFKVHPFGTAGAVRGAAVTGRTIVTAQHLKKGEAAVAYDLADGRRLWTAAMGDYDVAALTADGSEVFVLNRARETFRLRVLDLATGKEQQQVTVTPSRVDSSPTLWPLPSGLVLVSGNGGKSYPPLQGLPRPSAKNG